MCGAKCKRAGLYYAAIQDRASMNAILAFAAKHLDSLRGCEPSQRSIAYTVNAVHALSYQLQIKASVQSDAIILAIAMLAIAEVILNFILLV